MKIGTVPLFYVVGGLIMGGFIYFLLTITLEAPVLKKMRENKFGQGANEALTKKDTQGFYVLCAVISILLGLVIGYLGSQGKL